jgi:hypothetical protein
MTVGLAARAELAPVSPCSGSFQEIYGIQKETTPDLSRNLQKDEKP